MQKTKKHTKKTNTHIQSTFSQHIFHLTDTEQETFVLVFNDENFLHTDETHRICVANVLVPKFKKKKHMCNEWVENIIYEWECVYDLPVKSLICEWEPIPPHPAKENRELSHFILTLNSTRSLHINKAYKEMILRAIIRYQKCVHRYAWVKI